MKRKIYGLLAFTMLASPIAVQAQNLVGDWQGTILWPPGDIGNSYGYRADVNFQTQSPAPSGYSFTGVLDVTCTAVIAPAGCGTGGYLPFSGTLSANDALAIDFSGATSAVTGTLAPGGNELSFSFVNNKGVTGEFEVSRVAAPEMDGASAASGLTLLLGGLMVLRSRRSVTLEPATI